MMANVLVVLLFGGLVGAIWYGCQQSGDVKDTANSYLATLRQKNFDGAYAMLATQTQAKVPREGFDRAMSSHELSRSTDQIWNQTSSSSNGQGCVDGAVVIDDKLYSVTIWLWQQGDTWTIHTIHFERTGRSGEPWRCYSQG